MVDSELQFFPWFLFLMKKKKVVGRRLIHSLQTQTLTFHVPLEACGCAAADRFPVYLLFDAVRGLWLIRVD